MSKRKVAVVALAVVFALSATVLALMPAAHTPAPTAVHSIAALTFAVGPSFNPPECPDAGDCGFGGGP